MAAGADGDVSITLMNRGATTWTAQDGYALAHGLLNWLITPSPGVIRMQNVGEGAVMGTAVMFLKSHESFDTLAQYDPETGILDKFSRQAELRRTYRIARSVQCSW